MSERDAVREAGVYWVRWRNPVDPRRNPWFIAEWTAGRVWARIGTVALMQDGAFQALACAIPEPNGTPPNTEPSAPPEAPAAPAAAAERTVRVRAAVAIEESGDWVISGAPGESDERMMLRVKNRLGGMTQFRVSFVDADVPLPPAPATVAGEVVE